MFCFPGCFPLCQTDRSEIIPNILVRRKRNGPFHLNSDRNFRNLWHNGSIPKVAYQRKRCNPFHTNHMTTFLCHVTTSFGHHVISFLQPTVQNSNGRFTTLVILIVFSHTSRYSENTHEINVEFYLYVCIVAIHNRHTLEKRRLILFHNPK